MFSGGGLKATQACNWEKGHLDHQSCPFVFKREKQSMGSIKQICARSKWLQSLLPAPKILAPSMTGRDPEIEMKKRPIRLDRCRTAPRPLTPAFSQGAAS